jgi:hypothetical protein
MKLPDLGSMIGLKSSPGGVGAPVIPGYTREQLGEKQVFLNWEFISRHDTPAVNKRFMRAITIIGVFVGLLLLAMQEFFVILVIGSVIFVTQALMKMPPENIKYELSSFGVSINGKLYYWDQLRSYFFMQREGREIAAVNTTIGIPGRLFVDFEPKDRDTVRGVFNKYLHFMEEEPKTFFDTTYDKIVKRFGVEDKE